MFKWYFRKKINLLETRILNSLDEEDLLITKYVREKNKSMADIHRGRYQAFQEVLSTITSIYKRM